MTNANLDTTPAQPDDNERRDDLDLIDEAVAGITDISIEERLRATISRAGYACEADAEPYPVLARLEPYSLTTGHDAASAHWLKLLRQAHAEARAAEEARKLADQVLTDARTEADNALNEAARIVRDAREQAERIARAAEEARKLADQILTDARAEATEVVNGALPKATVIIRNAREEAERIISSAREEADEIRETARDSVRPVVIHDTGFGGGDDMLGSPGTRAIVYTLDHSVTVSFMGHSGAGKSTLLKALSATFRQENSTSTPDVIPVFETGDSPRIVRGYVAPAGEADITSPAGHVIEVKVPSTGQRPLSRQDGSTGLEGFQSGDDAWTAAWHSLDDPPGAQPDRQHARPERDKARRLAVAMMLSASANLDLLPVVQAAIAGPGPVIMIEGDTESLLEDLKETLAGRVTHSDDLPRLISGTGQPSRLLLAGDTENLPSPTPGSRGAMPVVMRDDGTYYSHAYSSAISAYNSAISASRQAASEANRDAAGPEDRRPDHGGHLADKSRGDSGSPRQPAPISP